MRTSIVAAGLFLGGCAGGRDVVPESRDVRGDGVSAASGGGASGAGGNAAKGSDAGATNTTAGGAGGGGASAGAGGAGDGGYEYVARRAHGVVGLAEARGLPREVSALAVDRVADQLEACAVDLAKRGQLVHGAARVVVKIAPDGSPSGAAVKIAPGAAVAANAILCFVAPVKALTFPADPGAAERGVALEATWDPS